MAILFALELGHLVPGLLTEPMCAEVRYAYSGAIFNEEFGPAEIARIARIRALGRATRKRANFQRYRRAYARQRAVDYWRYLQLHR